MINPRYTAQIVKNPPAVQECRRLQFDPWVEKIPWRREWLLTPIFLPAKLNGQRSFPGGSDGKELTCDVGDLIPSLSWEDPVEEVMATHSSILAWRIPWTEEPGGIQSMGSQRIRHDLSAEQQQQKMEWKKVT